MLPSGALSVFPHCCSSVCSRRSAICFPTAAAVLAPAGASSPPGPSPPQQPHATQEPPPAVFFTAAVVPALAGTFSIFPHCRSSACSSRILLYISPLPQQWMLPQEHLPFFPTTAVVSAPAGAPSIFSTAAAVPAPAGALPVFPHCRSSECSPQERYLYFLTAPAVSAPAGALPIFPHCRSSARSSRSFSPRLLPSPSPNTPPPPPFHHPQRPFPSPLPNSPTPP